VAAAQYKAEERTTIEELLAIEEIKNLRNGYVAHFDSHEVDALLGLFTEDAVCDFGEGCGKWRGLEEIGRNFRAAIQNVGAPFNSVHVMTNPWICIDSPTTAHGRLYLIDWAMRQAPLSGMSTRCGSSTSTESRATSAAGWASGSASNDPRSGRGGRTGPVTGVWPRLLPRPVSVDSRSNISASEVKGPSGRQGRHSGPVQGDLLRVCRVIGLGCSYGL
jgi:hypothetical protein